MGVSSQSRANKNSKEVEIYSIESLNSLRDHSPNDPQMLAGLSALDEVPQMQDRRSNAWNLLLRLKMSMVPEELHTNGLHCPW
jgi:hypothetical protein